MPFTLALIPVFIRPDGGYQLLEPLIYKGRQDTFLVPAGFVTDLASVPRFLTWLVPVAGVHDRAAILHDWLCTQLAECLRLNSRWTDTMPPATPPASARDTDGLFRRVLRELGVGVVRRWLMWVGVRWGALANPARRASWWRDAAAVLGISVLAVPFVLLPAVCTGVVVLIDQAIERWAK